jgi:hypothetical protein
MIRWMSIKHEHNKIGMFIKHEHVKIGMFIKHENKWKALLAKALM